MPYAVELLFDPIADTRVRGLWEALTATGAPCVFKNGARPHITLAVCESVQIPAAFRLLDRFALKTPAFSVTLTSIGLFTGTAPVVFLAPKVTPELLSLHASFGSGILPHRRAVPFSIHALRVGASLHPRP